MYKIVLYDTSNFIDFPIGGQLTSIRNFLRYVAESENIYCKQILLVGVTTEEKQVGSLQKIEIANQKFDFLPVLYRNKNLSDVRKSLRMEYLKGLFKYTNKICVTPKTINYIHTPEAYIQIKICHPISKTVVFSHGNFWNMQSGFRFYKNNKLIKLFFDKFIFHLLKHADLIFTLDKNCTVQYMLNTNKVRQIDNSIVLPESYGLSKEKHIPLKLLFVGRLSKIKRVDEIIKAMALHSKGEVQLLIVGDGEERECLETLAQRESVDHNVLFMGAVSPDEVGEYMRNNDILIMNSQFEGKPMTIIEALSYGMPIVTTPVGGIAELVINHHNSEYTDGTSQSISDAICTIASNYTYYSNNAFEAAKDYDYQKVNAEIWDFLVNLQ